MHAGPSVKCPLFRSNFGKQHNMSTSFVSFFCLRMSCIWRSFMILFILTMFWVLMSDSKGHKLEQISKQNFIFWELNIFCMISIYLFYMYICIYIYICYMLVWEWVLWIEWRFNESLKCISCFWLYCYSFDGLLGVAYCMHFRYGCNFYTRCFCLL